MPRITFLILVLFITGCSSSRAPRYWDASSMAGLPNPVVSFLDRPKGKVIGSVNTGDIRRTIYIKDRVEAAAGELRSRLLIADDNQPNGFSFDNKGHPIISITIGMINLIGQDNDAMAALMGHELAHMYLMHGKRRKNRDDNSIFASTVLTFALGFAGIPIPMDATDVATDSVVNSFSRDDEREADQLGVEIMANAGFDPWGAMRLQEKLVTVSGKTLLPFLSTHPTSAERADNMRRLAMETRPEQAPASIPIGSMENTKMITTPPTLK